MVEGTPITRFARFEVLYARCPNRSREWPTTHFPAYLESSNPKNLERYGRLGFEPLAEFSMPDGGPTVTTMWRTAREVPTVNEERRRGGTGR